MNHYLNALLLMVLVPTVGVGAARALDERHADGTIIVMFYSKDKVVVAADSRRRDETGTYTDDECKLLALDDQTLFVAMGRTYAEVVELGVTLVRWDAREELVSAYQLVKGRGLTCGDRPPVEDVALEWVLGARAKLEQLMAMGVDPTRGLEKAFVRGMFVGVEPDGQLRAVLATVAFTPGEIRNPVEAVVGRFELEENAKVFTMGKIEIVMQLSEGQTRWAKEELENWNMESAAKGDDADVFKAIRWVDLTIAFHPDKTYVGGEIDAIELRRGGKIRWVQRKAQCRQE